MAPLEFSGSFCIVGYARPNDSKEKSRNTYSLQS